MVADGRVMDYSNGMERVKKKGSEGRKYRKSLVWSEEKMQGRKQKGGKDGHREVGREEEEGEREGNSYIKILKMYECI